MERPHIISTLTKCFSAILLLTAYSILGFSQASITVRFSGQLDGSAYQRLDSVKVTDISKGWTETVYYPDTIAILRKTNSLGTITSDNNALYQNAPQPIRLHNNRRTCNIKPICCKYSTSRCKWQNNNHL